MTYKYNVLAVISISLFITLGYFILKSFLLFKQIKKTGINFIQPLPIFGNLGRFLLGKEHLSNFIRRVYCQFPNDRYVGVFEFFKPVIVIKDLQLLKDITVRDFNMFHDLPFTLDENVDSLMGRVLLFVKGEKWRKIRNRVSPMFTNSKLKTMGKYITQCAENMINSLESEINEVGNFNSINKEFKDISMRFSVDVVASCIYSFETNSFQNRKNVFFKNVLKISKEKMWFMIKIVLSKTLPKQMKALKLTLYGKEADFFRNILYKSMQHRVNMKEIRLDFLNLMINAKSDLSIEDIITQAFTFVLTSYGGIPQTASFLAYALAKDHQIQNKLRQEIDDLLIKNNGKADYEDIVKLKYLNMVISETLRRWTPLAFCTRMCNENYDLGPISEDNLKTYKMKKGDSIWLPIEMIHMDPENWPQPEKFDPERFSQENKINIKPYSYIPFGSGPRNCVGSKFALIQIKIFIFYLITHFELDICDKTFKEPIVLKAGSLFTEPKDDFWLKITKRKSKQ